MIQIKELIQLERFLPLIYDLQKETWPHDHLSKKEVFEKIIQLSQILGVNLNPDDPEFLPMMILKIKEISFQPPEQEAPSIPPNLSELVEDYDKAKKEQEEEIKKKVGSQENYSHYQKLENGLKKFIVVSTDSKIPEELAKRIAESAVDKIITSLPPVAQPEFFPEEDKEQILKEAKEIVDKEVKKVIREEVVLKEAEEIVGKEAEKIQKQREEAFNEFKKIIEAEAIKIAATPQIIRPFQEATKKETIVPSQIPSLSKEVLAKLNQATETISPLSAYKLLNPEADTGFFVKKTAHTPSARLIEFAVKNAPPEWQASKNWPIIQETVERRIFADKLQKDVDFFKKVGVPANHPLIQQFEDKIAELLKIQKNPKTGQDYRWVKILKNDSAAWSQGNYVSFLTPVRQFFYKKITQPIVGWLAKTAVGKAAQQGAKKAATWIAAKLGMKLAVMAGVAATGAATGPPGWVVAAVTIGLDILKTLGRKIIGFIRRIIQEPDKALGSIGVGVLLLIFIPMPFSLIAILPLAVGGLGLMTFIAAPATLGVIGGGVGAFFTAIAAIPIAAPIALFVIILFSVLAGLTLFIVLVVSGAFILPGKVAEVALPPSYLEYFDISKKTSASESRFENLKDGEIIKVIYTITIRPKKNYVLKKPNIEEKITVWKEGNIPNITPCNFEEIPEEISSETELKCTQEFNSAFNDSVINNTASLLVEINGISGLQKGSAYAMVTIGNPPVKCPSGWPVNTSDIIRFTQGPEEHGYQAIDISVNIGTDIFPTHEGIVIIADNDPGGDAGISVRIQGNCDGKDFSSFYAHLSKIEEGINEGTFVTKSTKIGESGTTGHSTGPHLHYELTGLEINKYVPPYELY